MLYYQGIICISHFLVTNKFLPRLTSIYWRLRQILSPFSTTLSLSLSLFLLLSFVYFSLSRVSNSVCFHWTRDWTEPPPSFAISVWFLDINGAFLVSKKSSVIPRNSPEALGDSSDIGFSRWVFTLVSDTSDFLSGILRIVDEFEMSGWDFVDSSLLGFFRHLLFGSWVKSEKEMKSSGSLSLLLILFTSV